MDIRNIFAASYVPYSRRPEAAVVYSSEGRYFAGKRIENVSYPLSIGAAQNALFCCLSEGDTPKELMTTDPGDRLLPYWKEEYGVGLSTLDAEDFPDFNFFGVVINKESDPAAVLPSLLDRALVEYSNFPVAALVETETGYIGGVNIECSSWNMGLCAERVAIMKALTYSRAELGDLHIQSRDGEFSSPCGACRQVINEHLSSRRVHLYNTDHSRSIHFSEDLLPFSFYSPSLSNS
ncbi:cytidine deaminase, homotetrameric [Fodinibius roseus]|uniref:Cytidine deaminase, homotetrameric n=1 Tax=Fodinibius roseus TaxID=1194090 RepID=A0A1M5FZF8_9BACT|nr:cytidine deaminase [Fodinibius roseus]SHF96849.1 cytidine deaminase, homotetrameric [Fodinibius roseus]